MNFSGAHRRRSIAALEITPLVDVVFLLLLFFLLTATYVRNPNIDIELPSASAQEMFQKDQDVTVVIKKDGQLQYDSRILTLAQLEEVFQERFRQQGAEAVVIVKADKGAQHGNVVDVMDLAKRVGFSKLAIAVSTPAHREP